MTQPPGYSDLLGLLPKEQVKSAVRLGLDLPPGLNRDSWSRLVASLVKVAGRTSSHRDTLTAWLGDLLVYGSDKYRGQISEYARAAGLAPGTLRDAKLVCSRIPVSSRRDTLSWSHHCEIGKAFKQPKEIERWLKIAEKGGHSKADLRRMIRSHLASVATSTQQPTNGQTTIEAFAVLRELRAVGRFLGNHVDSWTGWSPSACELALVEIEPIALFVAELKAGAQRIPIADTQSTTSSRLRSGVLQHSGVPEAQTGNRRMTVTVVTASNSAIL